MVVVIGVLLLIGAAVLAVSGILSNRGTAHTPTDPSAVLGYHLNASTGMVLLDGIVIGAIGLSGFGLLFSGMRYRARRARLARRDLAEARRETAAVIRDRDDLVTQHRDNVPESARASSNPPSGVTPMAVVAADRTPAIASETRCAP